MFQIVFNDLSAAEMSALPTVLQLELLSRFEGLPEDSDKLDEDAFGVLRREGKTLLRYRAGDYRIYFEKSGDGILIHRVLHKNTLGDFLYRTRLPMTEDEQLAGTREFWKLIDEAEAARARVGKKK